MKPVKLFLLLAVATLIIPIVTTDTYCKDQKGEKMEKDKDRIEPLVLIINYPYQIWSNDPTKIHLTLLKPDFRPAKNAIVTVDEKKVGKTDKNGVCIFDYMPGSNRNHKLTATLKEKGKTYKVFKEFACNARTVSYRVDRLFIYSDRGVYNPGQDILIRAIAWQLKGEYSPVPEEEIQLLLQDKNGKVFSGEYVKTNEFGIAATKLSLPDNMPEGDYELVVLHKKARESASIRVKRFVPPIINIEHNLKRYLTDSQEKLDAKIELSYFAGGKIKSSKLTFSVLNSNNEEVFKKVLTSDKPVYNISLKGNELNNIRQKLSLENDFKIKISAVDSYAQKNEIFWDITYTARPYTAVLEIDKDAYPEGETVQLLAKVVDIDKQPATGIPLTMELSGTDVKKKATTDDKGIAVFEFKMIDRSVTAIVKSTIMEPVLAQRTIPFQSRKPMISKASEPPKGEGQKTLITVNFDKDYKPVENVVHVDMTDISGALVVSTTIPVRREKNNYVAKGKVTSPTWGTMLVNLYCCAVKKEDADKPLSPETVGFVTEGQHITFYADKELEITVNNFKPKAKPGDEVTFNVEVKGGKGEKCLGVAVVDDAVISLLDPFIKNPVQHYYNPQAKVISTGGSGVLTWPVVDRNWGSPWRDIAYCNWGWKSPGGFLSGVSRDISLEEETMGAVQEAGPDVYDAISGEPMNGDEEESPPAPVYKKSASLAKSAPEAVAELDDKELTRAGRGITEKPKKKIIIRTHFPETSLWEPLLITKKGKAKINFRLPDEITTQNISIVATDKTGYIGFLRKDMKVTQPLFVRATFPATMVLGDKITVNALIRNLTNEKIDCKAELTSDNLKIHSSKEIDLTIPSNETVMAEWEISGATCGKSIFEVSCETTNFIDSEQKSIFVLPAGEPVKQLVKGTVKKNENWNAAFSLDKNATYRVVNLNVSMPNVFPAFQAWWAFENRPWYSPWATSAIAIMNSAMLDYAQQTNGNPKQISNLKQELSQSSTKLINQQFPSGAWGWYFLADATAPNAMPIVGGENLYYTVYVLRALAEIHKCGLPLDKNAVMKAVDYILAHRNDDGLWISKGAYFWEIFNEETDDALSAEIFEVLMLAATEFPELKKYNDSFEEIKKEMVSILKTQAKEPMTTAAAVKGIAYWSKIEGNKSEKKLLSNSIDYLINLKRKGYWEPHWYHAYGGMVELNARILELLAEFDPDRYDSYIREGVTYLVSTREAWGAWHNEIGTATAIKALLKTGTFAEEIPSKIAIKVNGKQVAKVNVDPDDPYLSAAKLRYFEISEWTRSGENDVEVIYNGNLTASVMMEINEWGVAKPQIDEFVEIKRTAPQNAELGEPVMVKLSIDSEKLIPVLTVEEHIPANSEIDISSIRKLKKEKKISDYTIEDETLYLVLIQVKDKIDLEYKLKPVRQGNAVHAGTNIIDATNGKLVASCISSALNID
jgi:hypothetical protein